MNRHRQFPAIESATEPHGHREAAWWAAGRAAVQVRDRVGGRVVNQVRVKRPAPGNEGEAQVSTCQRTT
jgi:hypothetical protein